MRRLILWIAVALAAAGVALLIYRAVVRLPELPVVVVKSQAVQRILAVVGRVRADERVSVYARTPGQIMSLEKDEGESVVAGEILGQIDAEQPRAVLAQRKAAAAAQQRLLAQSQRDLARSQALLKRGFVTRAGHEAARLAVERGSEQLTQLESAVGEARSRLEDFVIRSPMKGKVLLRPVDPGQVVDVRTVIFELASGGAPEVETDVDETVAGGLRVGMTARLSPAGMNSAFFRGRVTFVAPQIDPTTGGRTVRLSFDAAPKDIPPGLSVDVNVDVEKRDTALTLPRSAIGDPSGTPFVLMVQSSKTLKRPITFIDWPAERVIVTSGIQEGDQVALDPFASPEGRQVLPVVAAGSP
jgi:membrane fusion protein, multidrug efflux system